jgi:hypothetical protein
MLVRQAAAQFKIWTGRSLEIGQIKKALLRTLEGKPAKPRSVGLKKGKG